MGNNKGEESGPERYGSIVITHCTVSDEDVEEHIRFLLTKLSDEEDEEERKRIKRVLSCYQGITKNEELALEAKKAID